VAAKAQRLTRRVGMDELTFDRHARDEMARDAVSEDEVYIGVANDDVEYEQCNGVTRYERMIDDGRMIVVIAEAATRTVKTGWWDKRASRRRRW
jgi:hypothetical protein